MDNMSVLLPVVEALQNKSLQPVHWERLQAVLSGLQVGPGTDYTLEQLVAVKVCLCLCSPGPAGHLSSHCCRRGTLQTQAPQTSRRQPQAGSRAAGRMARNAWVRA